MTVRLMACSLIVAMILFACSAAAAPADPANPAPADDPLPEGAQLRFGVTRPILRMNPGVGLLAPKFTNFLAPTTTGSARRYDLGTGRPLEKGLVGPGHVLVSVDGKRAAVARPGVLTIIDVENGEQILAVRPPEGIIISGVPGVSLSANGKVLAYGGRAKEGKGEVIVWDVDKDEVLARLETSQAAPVFPTLSHDGKTVITHGPPLPAPNLGTAAPKNATPKADVNPDQARTAQVWDVETANELFKARVTGMGGTVVTSAFSPKGDFVAISSGDGPVDLWDVKTGKRLHTLLGRKGQGVKVAISPDGKTVASVGPDYRIQRWTSGGKPLGVSEAPSGILIAPITGLTFADNERAIAWLTAAQFAVAWEAPSGRLLSPAMDHQAAIRSTSFADGGKDFLTSGIDGRVFRWDLPTGQMLEMIHLQPARLPGAPLIRPVVNLSADGTRASWLRTPTEVFDMATGADAFCVPPPSAPQAPVSTLLSPDGMKLLTLSRQADARRPGSCVVWDLATQKRVAEFEIPSSASPTAPIAALSPEGSRLVLATSIRNAAGQDVFVVVGYDLKTGKKLAEVEDPGATGSMSLAVANDTTAVVTSTTGRVWPVDYVNGKIEDDIDKLDVRGESAVYGQPVFSADGKKLAIGVGGEKVETYGVKVYDFPGGKAPRTFIGHVAPVTSIRFSPDGKSVASGAHDTSVLLWDLSKNQGGK